MALTQDLPISNSMYKLLNLIIDARQQFPKAFRYEFGTESVSYTHLTLPTNSLV